MKLMAKFFVKPMEQVVVGSFTVGISVADNPSDFSARIHLIRGYCLLREIVPSPCPNRCSDDKNHTAGAPNRIPFYFLLVSEENNTSHFFDAPIKLPEVIEAIVRRIHTGMHRSLLVSLQHLRVDRLNRIDSLSLSPPAGKRTQQI